MTGEPDPSWPRDAARAVGHEIATYARTVRLIMRGPARFAADWSAGRLPALNPLAFLLNALAVLGPWRAVWGRLFDPNPPTTPLWFELSKPIYPVVVNSVMTALAHVIIQPLGGRRPLRSSVAMTLYVSGGPLSVVGFLVAPLSLYGYLHRGSLLITTLTGLLNLTLLVTFFAYLIVMEAALHGISRWRVAFAVLAAWTTWGVFSGWLSFRHPELIRAILE
jgi:hypothetical protein